MFQGATTAIVTPFKQDGSLDLDALKKLVDFQIENKIDGILPCGTTGESPTLIEKEQIEVIKTVVDQAAGKVKVLGGAGSNSTEHAVHMTKEAVNVGVDGTLHVCPYYNKPTQEGLYRHFSAIAKASDKPVIVYNIKGRTAINMETKTLARLSKEFSNIVGVKEASGDINQMKDVINTLPKEFDVLSGDDNMTYELMEAGGKGVISVASNIIPEQIHYLTKNMLDGNKDKGKEMHEKLMPLFKAMFIETNPLPVKTSLAEMGMIKESFRLPMCEMRPENKEKLVKVLAGFNIV